MEWGMGQQAMKAQGLERFLAVSRINPQFKTCNMKLSTLGQLFIVSYQLMEQSQDSRIGGGDGREMCYLI